MKNSLLMIKIYIFLFLLAGLSACSRPEGESIGYGYLDLEEIVFTVDGEVITLTRAVDAGLQVQIYQNGGLVEGHDYAPGTDFSKRIVLPVGENYRVKAFTPDQTEATTGEAGHPVYEVESEIFRVSEGDITAISLVAPQLNVGVDVSFDESFTAVFTDISVTIVSESTRSVTIVPGDEGFFRYFHLPVCGELTYTVKCTNADGESMEETKTLPVGAENYTIRISI